jgi:caa(3)-type oxidase subunit IV
MAGAHAHPNYVKIWALLLVLLVVSIIGPEFGIPWLTLVTAFGIALVKTYYVAAYFMHLNFEKKYVLFLLILATILVGVFFFGVASDVMKAEGQNWKDCISNNTCAEQQRFVNGQLR